MPTTIQFKWPSHVAQSYDAASVELQFRNAHRLAAVRMVLFQKETCAGKKKNNNKETHGAAATWHTLNND